MNFYADSRKTFCRTIRHTLKISHLNQPIRFFVKDDFIITIGPEPVKTIPAFMMPLLVNGLVDAHGPGSKLQGIFCLTAVLRSDCKEFFPF